MNKSADFLLGGPAKGKK